MKRPNALDRFGLAGRVPIFIGAWIALFLASNLLLEMRGNTNPHSRYALLCALSEDHSPRIDSYVGMTVDWARTPDGHYYSNKAPGPALLAFPLFWPIDRLLTHGLSRRGDRDAQRLRYRWQIERWLSLLLQALPFALLVLAAACLLWREGIDPEAIRFFCAACLFGNTASVFMNTFFGHGMAAVWTLGLAIALWRRHLPAAGLCFGMSLLSDYGSALYLPGLLVAIALLAPGLRGWLGWIAGGAPAAIAWCVYHTACFGSPWVLPNRYQNPQFVDAHGSAVWGVIDWVPHGSALWELLVGSRRGLLWTQPWVLIAAIALVAARRRSRNRSASPAVPVFAWAALAGLLAMNAAFGAWHAGNTPGPRYLAAVFPAVALAIALGWKDLSTAARNALWLGLFFSLVLYAVVMSTLLDAEPDMPLWKFYAAWLALGHWRTMAVRLPLLVAGWWFCLRTPAPAAQPIAR